MSTIQYVTVAQALASNASGLNVKDTAANIAGALPNASLTSRVSSFSLSASSTLAGAALAKLAALTGFSLNSFQLTVADAAFVLLSLSRAEISLVSQATLTGSPTLNAAQLAQLEGLPHFTVAAGDHVTVSDSLANIAGAIGTHPAWFTPVSAVTVRLDGSHVGAFAAAQLGLLEAAGKTVTFNASGNNTTLTVAAAAASIAASAAGLNDLNGHVTVAYTVTNPGVAVSAATGAALAGIAGFNPAAQALPVVDTGANITAHAAALFGHGFVAITVSSGNFAGTAAQLLDASLHESAGASVTLNASATINAANAATLAALQGFSKSNGIVLTVQDHVANLLALPVSVQAVANVLALAADETVTVAQLTALYALGGEFSNGGHALTVQGTAAGVEAVPGAQLQLASLVVLLDTAANLAGAAAHNWGNTAPVYELSQNGIVAAAQATTLAGLGNAFRLNGFTLGVQDNAANVVANSAALGTLGVTANVTDTVANLAGSEAALALLGNALGSVTINDPGTSTANAAALLQPLVAKLSAASALTVADTAAGVSQGDLTVLEAIAAKIGANLTLQISGTAGQLAADAAAFAGTGATLQFTLSGGTTVTAQQAVNLAPYVSGVTLNVTDTGANIALYTAQLAAVQAKIGTLTLADGTSQSAAVAAGIALSHLDTHLGANVALTVTDSSANIAAAATGLQQLSTDGKLAAIADNLDSAASVASHLAVLNSLHAHVTVQDTTANVQASFDALSQVQGLTRVTLTDTGAPAHNIALTVAQLNADATTVAAIIAGASNYQFNLLDTAANIAADLTSANSLILADTAELHSVVSTNGPISLSLADAHQAPIGNALTNFALPYNLTNVSIANITSGNYAALLSGASNIAIADSSANFTANLASNAAITTNNGLAHVDSLSVTDNGPISLTVAQLGGVALLFSQTPHLIVADSASDVAGGLTPHAALIQELIASPGSISSITAPGGGTLSVSLTVPEAQQLASAGLLSTFAGLLSPGSTLSVTASITDLAAAVAIPLGQLAHLNVSVVDTAANLAADLLSHGSLLQQYSTVVGSVTLAPDSTQPLPTLTAAGLNALYTYGVAQPNNPVTLLVADSLAGILAISPTALETASTVAVTDTAANLTADFGVAQTASALQTLASHFGVNMTITLSDTTPVVSVSWAIVNADAAALSAITNVNAVSGRGPVTVTDTAANLVAHTAALSSDNFVGKVVVADTAANVLAQNLSTLQGLGALLWVQLTDAQIAAAALTTQSHGVTLLQSAHLSTTGGGVFDTAQNIAGLATLGGATGAAAIAFLNAYGATVTSVSPAYLVVSQLQGLEQLTALHTGGQSFTVFDTATNLTGQGVAAALSSPLVSAVYLNANGNAASLTAATTVALFNTANFHNTDLSGTANAITVDDTAAGIDALHSQLAALGNRVAGIIVDETATQGNTESVSAATLADLQALGATLANGTLYVQDTAANIANAVALAPASPSLTPTGWKLSTSGTVTEAQALALGGLAGALATNVGGHQYTVILNLTADATITATQANALGNLGAALVLNLNGHHLILNDTAAHLINLTAAAKADVVPGTSVVVNDTAPISEATAASFLTLLSNHVFTVSQLSFAHAESVADTLANLSTLTTTLQNLTGNANTGWTGDTALLNAFQFTATETVANLISAGNTAQLAALAGSTVISGQTANAADAETLATLASQIHFSLGTNTLTVSDTAANLLSALNQAGVALASTVELSAANVTAPQALALLSLQNFAATGGNPLVVQDTAANLLNPGLDALLAASPAAANITVDLLASPAVTVAQAAELLSLPNFSAGSNLLIADSTANLLNAANSTVVAGAQAVTLAGNESVTAATILGLSHLSNFQIANPGAALTLSASATVDQPTLLAIANLGTHFNAGGNTITLSANVTVNATQFAALQNDGVVLHGQTMTVSDSVSNLTSLVASQAWTGSVALHGSYLLVATDTAANLAAFGGGFTLAGVQQSENEAFAVGNATLTSLSAVVAATTSHTLGHNGYTMTISGTAAQVHGLNAATAGLATTFQVNVADAITLLGQAIALAAGQTVTVSDTAANLEAANATLPAAISGGGYTNAQVITQLATGQGVVSVSNVTLPQLLGLPNFGLNGNSLSLSADATVTGPQGKLIADMGANFQAGVHHVIISSDATGLTATELANLYADNLQLGGHHVTVSDTAANLLGLSANAAALATTLSLSAPATVSPAQLATLAGLGNFTDSNQPITLSADSLNLTPAQYIALQNDGVLANQVANGHVISAALGNIAITDTNNLLSLTNVTSVPGSTVKVYDQHGGLLSAIREGHSGFTITAADTVDHSGNGQAFAFTEVVNGVESAPVVVLDQAAIEAAVTAAGATFANNGAISLNHNNETLAIYTAGVDVPQNLANPALVYDPHAHTVSLDIPNSAPLVLITLGAATDPAAAAALDVVVKHHG